MLCVTLNAALDVATIVAITDNYLQLVAAYGTARQEQAEDVS